MESALQTPTAYLKDLAAIAALIRATTGIGSFLVAFKEVRQGRVIESFTKVVKSFEEGVKSHERRTAYLRKGALDMSKELKMRDSERKTREQEWKKTVYIAKDVKYIMEKQRD